ncbi:MAG: hypothetical protein ACI80P_001427 [Flavobacteriales bacterium]|jgi:hypothetical protein
MKSGYLYSDCQIPWAKYFFSLEKRNQCNCFHNKKHHAKMNQSLAILFAFSIAALCCTENPNPKMDIQVDDEQTFWTAEKSMRHLQNRNDSAAWDQEMLLTDLEQTVLLDLYLRFEIGVFPTPNCDLIGEGSFKGVGMFNLTQGQTILIAHQKDNSLRSLQLNLPELSSDEIDQYTAELLEKNEISAFFTSPGNI